MMSMSPRNSHDEPFQHFANVLLSSKLSPQSLSVLKSSGRQIRVARGEIAELGAIDRRTAIFVLEGSAKLVGHLGPEREQIVAFGFSGDLLLLSSSPQNSHALYVLQALKECSLLAFAANDLIASSLESQGGSSAIFEQIFLALDRARDPSVLLGRKTAQEKLASFLVSMAERIGFADGSTIYLDLPMSRREIGDCLGLTIETISRQMTVLRNQDIIKTQDRSKIAILDLHRLREFAALVACVP